MLIAVEEIMLLRDIKAAKNHDKTSCAVNSHISTVFTEQPKSTFAEDQAPHL